MPVPYYNDTLRNIMRNFYKIIESLIDITRGVLKFVWHTAVLLIKKAWIKFLGVNNSGKIIILNVIPAFFAVVLPVARFRIFDSYFDVNNPFAVHMIGIIVLMFVCEFFKRIVKLVIRLLLNTYYLFWIIYTPLAGGGLTKAQPHEITFGYYFNIAVPLIFMAASVYNYYEDNF